MRWCEEHAVASGDGHWICVMIGNALALEGHEETEWGLPSDQAKGVRPTFTLCRVAHFVWELYYGLLLRKKSKLPPNPVRVYLTSPREVPVALRLPCSSVSPLSQYQFPE